MEEPEIFVKQLSKLQAGIVIDAVSYSYPRCKQASLSDINLNLHAGQCTGLIGPNGAGKSTLLSILSGLIIADQGEVRFQDVKNMSVDQYIRRHVALVPQEYAFYSQLTVLQNLNYFASLCCLPPTKSNKLVEYALQQCNLLNEKNQRAKWLSGGFKRRLNLAIALLKEPSILFLDEPTVGVDPVSRETILSLIKTLKAQGKTIVFTSHMLTEVQLICDEIVMMNQGRAIQIEPTNDRKLLDVEVEMALSKSIKTALCETVSCQFISDTTFQCCADSINEIFDILQVIENGHGKIRTIHYGKESLTQQYMTLLEYNDSA